MIFNKFETCITWEQRYICLFPDMHSHIYTHTHIHIRTHTTLITLLQTWFQTARKIQISEWFTHLLFIKHWSLNFFLKYGNTSFESDNLKNSLILICFVVDVFEMIRPMHCVCNKLNWAWWSLSLFRLLILFLFLLSFLFFWSILNFVLQAYVLKCESERKMIEMRVRIL